VRPVIKRLKDELLTIAPGQAPDALRVLSTMRECLEGTKQAGNYPTLNLYANWCLHPVLDRPAALRVLESVNDAIRELLQGQSPEGFDQLLSVMYGTVVATARLRAEIRDVAVGLSLPLIFVESYSSWRRLLDDVFQQIERKPIQYPDPLEGSARKQWDRCVAKPAMAEKPGLPARLVSKIVTGRVEAEYNSVGVLVETAGWRWRVHLAVPNMSDDDVILELPASEAEPPAAFRIS
jgi:hypothetical protein